MTRQEEIRLETAKLLVENDMWKWEELTTLIQEGTLKKVDKILSYLHSQGVVISNGGTCVVGDLSTEPLIEEKNDRN